MGDLLHKLNRRQLLELLVSQGKELEEQKKATEAAQARVAELEEKLRSLTVAALDAVTIVEQAREEADAYAQARRAEAEEEAAAIVAGAMDESPNGEENANAPAQEETQQAGPAQAGA